jgi:ribonucleotide monophosphatase NagD (HAD superfamily)
MIKAKLYAFDVHGVLITRMLDDPEVLGGHEVVRRLKLYGSRVAVIGSGSNWSTREYAERLRALGFGFDDDEVWPAARVARVHLSQSFRQGPRVGRGRRRLEGGA